MNPFSTFFNYIKRQRQKKSDNPYVEIVSSGIDKNGRLKIEFDWNSAFVDNLREAGFEGRDETEIVQKWFEALTHEHMNELAYDDMLAAKAKISPDAHPDL